MADNIQVIRLVNHFYFNLSFACIAYQSKDSYFLVGFKGTNRVMAKEFKSIAEAKKEFVKLYQDQAVVKGDKPVWSPASQVEKIVR